VHVLCKMDSDARDSMFEFVARILGLGFEESGITVGITMSAIAVSFSIACWFVPRNWGPLRNRVSLGMPSIDPF